jgi:hypothetical protein
MLEVIHQYQTLISFDLQETQLLSLHNEINKYKGFVVNIRLNFRFTNFLPLFQTT